MSQSNNLESFSFLSTAAGSNLGEHNTEDLVRMEKQLMAYLSNPAQSGRADINNMNEIHQ